PDDAGAAIAEASCVLGGRLFDGKGVSRLGLDESGIKRIRVALDATGNQCGGQRLVDGVILMIARGLLGDAGLATAVILKRNEIQDIIQKSARLQHAPQQRRYPRLEDALALLFVARLTVKVGAVDGAPGHKAVPAARERAEARLNAIGDNQKFVVGK